MAIEEEVLRRVETGQQRLVSLAQELVRIPSVNPPGDESSVADLMESELKALGLKVERLVPSPKRVNLCATLKGEQEGRWILFNGHMDVVPVGDSSKWSVDPFGGVVKEGRLYGRGAADMKGALASIVAAVKCVVDSELKLTGGIAFHSVADEETGGRFGTRFLAERGLVKGDLGVVCEGSVFSGKVYVRPASRGAIWLKITTIGRAEHASRPAHGVNAVISMSKMILALRNLTLDYKPHKYLPPPTISPGTTISGGIKRNVIPEKCVAEVDIRILPGMGEEYVLKKVEEIVDRLGKEDGSFKAEVELLDYVEASEISEDSEPVQLAVNSGSKVLGYAPTMKGGWGSNDSTYLNNAGVPTVCAYGPGDIDLGSAHGADENVGVVEMVSFSKIYALMMLSTCALGT